MGGGVKSGGLLAVVCPTLVRHTGVFLPSTSVGRPPHLFVGLLQNPALNPFDLRRVALGGERGGEEEGEDEEREEEGGGHFDTSFFLPLELRGGGMRFCVTFIWAPSNFNLALLALLHLIRHLFTTHSTLHRL